LTFSVAHFNADKGFFKPHEAWVLHNGELKGPRQSIFHVASCWSRRLFDAVRGYPTEGTGYDLIFEQRLAQHFPAATATYTIQPEDIYYLYRWGGTNSYHMSAYGYLQEGQNVGHQQVEEFVQDRAIRGEIPQGDIPLQPSWRIDYRQLVSSHISTLAGKSSTLSFL
ncbi:MAG: hypothetical protein KDE31_08220, partial [Caldilineaceae bacterium]|nr:hypothetical protein [Caldilineaceae bacterium]